jgi:hypothetical protein
MPIRAKYVHTNLIARDWKRLVRFGLPSLFTRKMPLNHSLSHNRCAVKS